LAVDARYVVTWAALGADQAPQRGIALSTLCPETEIDAWHEYRRCMEERVAVQFVGACPLTQQAREIRAYPHGEGGISIFSRAPTARPTRDSTVVPARLGEARLRELLSAVLEQLTDAAYLADTQGLHALNERALALVGYANQEELPRDFATLARELSLRSRRTREPLTLEQLPWSRALRGEAHVQELVMRPRMATCDRAVRVMAAPLHPHHELRAALCVVSDIPEEDDAIEEERARAEFEQKLIGIVSHDLRNPLQVIRFAASVGQSAAREDPRQVRHFQRILSASARALRMVEDLLDFTRIRFTGALGIEVKQVDMHALAEQTVAEVLTTHPSRSVQIQATGDGVGNWDPDRLLQILQNLIGNALQHTTEDAPVRVTTRGEEREVVLEVHNGGTPIPEDEQRRLFEPFQRARGTPERGGRSMGLGLFITTHLVQAHGGTVRLESNAESGTTFTVHLPRVPPRTRRGTT
jgi:signal transduction histidine kinase